MKNFFLCLLILLFVNEIYSQNFYIVKNTYYYGVINEKGDLVIPFEYSKITKNNLQFICHKSSKSGLLDTNGNVLLDIKYQTISPRGNIYTITLKDSVIQYFDPRYNSISEKIFVKEDILDSTKFLLYDDKNTIYIYDNNISKVLETKYQEIKRVVINDNDEEKASIFDYMKPADKEGLQQFYYVKENNKYGAVDEKLKIIMPIKFDNLYYDNKFWYATIDGNKGCYLKTGKVIIEAGIYRIYTKIYGTGYYFVKKEKYGVFDAYKQKEIIPTEYDNYFIAGIYYIFRKEGKNIVTNANFKIIFTTTYDLTNTGGDLFVISGGDAPLDFYKGLINTSGNVVVQPKYKNIHLRDNYYLLDKEYTIRPDLIKKYQDLKSEYTSKGLNTGSLDTLLMINAEKAVCDINGKIIFDGNYNDIRYNSKSKTFVIEAYSEYLNGKYYYNYTGVVSRHGELLLDTIYKYSAVKHLEDEVNCYADSSIYVISLDKTGKMIDNVRYKNYIELEIDTLNDVYWRYEQIFDEEKNPYSAWNLYNCYNKRILYTAFDGIDSTVLSSPAITLGWYTKERTKHSIDIKGYIFNNQDKKYSVKRLLEYKTVFAFVDKPKAKILKDEIVFIDTTELSILGYTKCFFTNGNCQIISSTLQDITPKYKYISEFVNNYAVAFVGGEYHINKDDKMSVDLAQTNNNIFLRLGADFTINRFHVLKSKVGIINIQGDTVIPFKYSYLNIANDQKIIAATNLDKKLFGIININDSVLINFEYDDLQFFYYTNGRQNYWYDCKYLLASKKQKYGVITTQNEKLIDFEYSNIVYLPNDYGHFFAVEKDKKWGLLDSTGNTIIPINYDKLEYINTNKNFFKVSITGLLYGYLDPNFMFQIVPQFDDAKDFKDGFARVEIDGKWNFVNTNGKLISENYFDECKDFYHDKAVVKSNRLWGVINTAGEYIIPPQYEMIGNFYGDIAPAKIKRKKKAKYAIINQQNQFLCKPKYKNIADFEGDYSYFQKRKKKGIINKDAEIIYKPKYKDVQIYSEYKIAIVKNNKNQYIILDLIDPKNKFKTKYKDIKEFSEGYAVTCLDGLYGYIDSTGFQVIENKYKDAENFIGGLALIKTDKFYGYINQKNEQVIKPKYKKAKSFSYEIAKVEDYFIDAKENRIDNWYDFEYYNKATNSGYYLNPARKKSFFNVDVIIDFEKIMPCQNFYIYKNSSLYGIVDIYGNELVNKDFLSIQPPAENLILVKTKLIEGVYNHKGEIIAPVEYMTIEPVNTNVIKCDGSSKTNYIYLRKNAFIRDF